MHEPDCLLLVRACMLSLRTWTLRVRRQISQGNACIRQL
jgi:hypothetical protein